MLIKNKILPCFVIGCLTAISCTQESYGKEKCESEHSGLQNGFNNMVYALENQIAVSSANLGHDYSQCLTNNKKFRDIAKCRQGVKQNFTALQDIRKTLTNQSIYAGFPGHEKYDAAYLKLTNAITDGKSYTEHLQAYKDCMKLQ